MVLFPPATSFLWSKFQPGFLWSSGCRACVGGVRSSAVLFVVAIELGRDRRSHWVRGWLGLGSGRSGANRTCVVAARSGGFRTCKGFGPACLRTRLDLGVSPVRSGLGGRTCNVFGDRGRSDRGVSPLVGSRRLSRGHRDDARDRANQGEASVGVVGGLTSFMIQSVCLNSGAVMCFARTCANLHP